MHPPSRGTTRRSLLGTGLTAAVVGLAGCAGFAGPTETERSTQSYSGGDYDRVAVDNRNGDVLVQPGEREDVEVGIVKRGRSQSALDDVSVTDSVAGGVLSLETEYENQFSGVRVDLTVGLPDGVALESARTGNGDVTARDVPGDASLSTGNGDSEADGMDGFVTVESANGDAIARGTTGVLGASTANGDVEVEVLALRDDAEFSSANGNVEVGVAPDLDADVHLSVGNGDVEVEVDLSESNVSRNRVTGRLGDGGPELRLSTGNGDVRLYALE